jgi:Chalcone isomerase-like
MQGCVEYVTHLALRPHTMTSIKLCVQNTVLAWALALALAVSLNVSAAEVEGHRFDDRVRVADTDLVLNGIGFRAVLMFKAYAAALYMTEKADTPLRVLAVSGAKRIQIKMLLDVDAKEFTKAVNVGIPRNSTEAEGAALKYRMEQFDRSIDAVGKIRKGDVVTLDFVPGKGMVFSLNGVVKGQTIPGADFYAGVLRIFLGDKPVDQKLKAGLLSLPGK